MAVHESGVNYQNLIRDLAEMYPFEVPEVVLIELIANALDAGATRISIAFDPGTKVLVVQDNGEGMDAQQFDEYHDFAVGLKTRGDGIGFAGVGAKISFNVAQRVITETRSESFVGGSNWYLQSKRKLVWEDIRPENLRGIGTRVEVRFRSDASLPDWSSNAITQVLRRHYLPLLDPTFLSLYQQLRLYSNSLVFVVNGTELAPESVIVNLGLAHVREFYPTRAGKRIGYGILGLAASEYPISPDVCGVLLCTRGKVIKADLFNQFPGALTPRLFGVVELPQFVQFLTTSKTDFLRGRKHREFERLYDPIRREFKAWLGELGIQPAEISDSDEAAKIERELKKLLDDIPELSDFFGFRSRKPVLTESEGGHVRATISPGAEVTFPIGEGEGGEGAGPVDAGDGPGEALVRDGTGAQTARPISRAARRGPKIAFAEAPERVDLAWVDGSNVVINSGHPCYLRIGPEPRARRLHCLFAIGAAIQRFLAAPGDTKDLILVDRMMAAWGKK